MLMFNHVECNAINIQNHAFTNERGWSNHYYPSKNLYIGL